MIHPIAVLLALAVIILPGNVVGQAPASAAGVPIYPGAVRVPAREAELRADRQGMIVSGSDLPAAASMEIRVWRIKEPAEAVTKFYHEKLAARDRSIVEKEELFEHPLEHLKAGMSTPVAMGLMLVDFEARLEVDLHAGTKAAQVRAAFVKMRAPLAPNQWVDVADFEWTGEDASSHLFHATVSVEQCCNTDKAVDVPMETIVEVVVERLPNLEHLRPIPEFNAKRSAYRR